MKPACFAFFNICIVLILFSGCHSSMDYDNSCSSDGSYPNLIISSRQSCGWAGFQDSILIDKNKIRYYNVCGPGGIPPGFIPKQYPITCAEWDSLVNAVDLERFSKLGYESCGSCVDGCDISIGIKTDTSYHKVTFAAGYAPKTIQTLAAKIASRRSNLERSACK